MAYYGRKVSANGVGRFPYSPISILYYSTHSSHGSYGNERPLETSPKKETNHQNKKSEGLIMALISITIVFAAHIMHYITYFRSVDVYPKILMEVKWLFY